VGRTAPPDRAVPATIGRRLTRDRRGPPYFCWWEYAAENVKKSNAPTDLYTLTAARDLVVATHDTTPVLFWGADLM
jgi:hypothetical protein